MELLDPNVWSNLQGFFGIRTVSGLVHLFQRADKSVLELCVPVPISFPTQNVNILKVDKKAEQ